MSNNEKVKSASERLSDIENALMSMFNTLDTMARDLTTLRDSTSLVNNKVDSIIASSTAGEAINNDNVRRHMIANNVQGLKDKVDTMIAQGFLSTEEIATQDSFVVGQEIDVNGEVANPRLQFVISSITDETVRNKIVGSKAGDLIDFSEGKLKLKVLETYRLTQNDQAATPLVTAEAAPEAEASFAATSSSQDAEVVETTPAATAAS